MTFTATSTITFKECDQLSREDLIALCKEHQDTILSQDKVVNAALDMLASMNGRAFAVVSQLGALVDSFDANDQGAIKLQLQRMSDQRKSFKRPEVH